MSLVSRFAFLTVSFLSACSGAQDDGGDTSGGLGDGDGAGFLPGTGGWVDGVGGTGQPDGPLGAGGVVLGAGGLGAGATNSDGQGSGGLGSGGLGSGSGGQPTGTGGESPDGGFVEDEGADCAIGELPESGALPTIDRLPNPFEKMDGSTMSTRSEWRCRRQEIKRLAEKFVYGEKPAQPETVTGTVSESSITVEVSHGGKSTSFSVSVDLPSGGSGPYPALISYGGGFFGFSQSGVVQGEGVAIIEYDPYDVGSESASRQNKGGAFYDIYGSNSETGLLAAWAWGVSRIIDVIEASGGDIIQADSLAVAGCSRFGKGAIVAGAFDQRMALTIPFESGTAGVPIWRGIPGEGAQSLSSAYGETYWFGDAFSAFTGSPTKLPIDTHEVLAMVAPRGLLVLDNPHIANLGPQSAHVAALGAAEVYSALGAGENISYHSAVADGGHCSARPEHVQPLKDNIQKFLFRAGSTPGAISAAGNATGNLSNWRDWTTPTLN